MAHNKSSIQEANKHLHLLHNKIEALEKQLIDKEATFCQREKELSDSLEISNDAMRRKDRKLRMLSESLDKQNVEIASLVVKAKEKDTVIARLQHKCEVIDYVTKHKGVLEEIVSVLSAVQRLDQKGHQKTEGETTRTELSRKTEAHGISEAANSAPIQPQSYRTFDGRFSISEDDDIPPNDIPDDVFSKSKLDKELYL